MDDSEYNDSIEVLQQKIDHEQRRLVAIGDQLVQLEGEGLTPLATLARYAHLDDNMRKIRERRDMLTSILTTKSQGASIPTAANAFPFVFH